MSRYNGAYNSSYGVVYSVRTPGKEYHVDTFDEIDEADKPQCCVLQAACTGDMFKSTTGDVHLRGVGTLRCSNFGPVFELYDPLFWKEKE